MKIMKMFKKNSKVMPNGRQGFTLIELLVVIAIIGMLSSIVLVSLNSARGKSSDAAIRANMSGIRTQAEVWYDTNGSYVTTAITAGACPTSQPSTGMFSDNVVWGQITQAKANSGGFNACAAAIGVSGSWAVVTQMKVDNTTALCVDSTGLIKTSTVAANTQAGITGLINVTKCS